MMEVPMRLAVLPSNEDTPADHEEVEEPDDDEEEEEEESIQREFQHVIPSSNSLRNTNRGLITNTRSSSEPPRPATPRKISQLPAHGLKYLRQIIRQLLFQMFIPIGTHKSRSN